LAFYEDLCNGMNEWLCEGDQLVLGIDANKDVQTGRTLEFASTLGLQEVILEKHSKSSPPATYNGNYSPQPIDDIFAQFKLWEEGMRHLLQMPALQITEHYGWISPIPTFSVTIPGTLPQPEFRN
jgi:hypothetical protein